MWEILICIPPVASFSEESKAALHLHHPPVLSFSNTNETFDRFNLAPPLNFFRRSVAPPLNFRDCPPPQIKQEEEEVFAYTEEVFAILKITVGLGELTSYLIS